jgi:hypothetical protein
MKKEISKLLFGLWCFLWIALKVYDLMYEGNTMSANKKTAIVLGFFAFSVLGIDNLREWWKLRKQRKAQ